LCPTSIFVYIGKIVPPLKPFERREGAERQGGEFVEAYVAKRTKYGGSAKRKEPP